MRCLHAAVHTKDLPSAGHITQDSMYMLQAKLQFNTSGEKQHPNVPPVVSRQPPASRPHPEHGAPPPSHTAEAKQQTVVSRWEYSTCAPRTGTGTGCRRRRRRAGARGERNLAAARDRTGALLGAHARERAMQPVVAGQCGACAHYKIYIPQLGISGGGSTRPPVTAWKN
jgi:hypothetical protein